VFQELPIGSQEIWLFPASPVSAWTWDANLWTLIGALSFLAGSYLLIPELFDADAPTAVTALAAMRPSSR